MIWVKFGGSGQDVGRQSSQTPMPIPFFSAIFNLVDNPQTAKIHKRLGPGYRRLVIGEYGAATALECYILFAKRFPVLVDQVARKPNGMFKSLTL